MVAEALPCLARFSLKLFIAALAFCSICDVNYNILGLQMQVPQKRIEVNAQKSWMRWVFLLIVWVLIVSMIKDYMQTKKGFLRVKETENRLKTAKETNENLKKKLSLVSSEEYKEKLIREKLNMQKDDEVVVVLPGKQGETIRQDSGERVMANWEKWLSVLGIQEK